jgi:hypothetical protein
VVPLPCDVDSERPAGRIAAKTGMPRVSRPVRSAMRVMPSRGASGANRRQVAASAAARWVPPSARRLPVSGSEKQRSVIGGR